MSKLIKVITLNCCVLSPVFSVNAQTTLESMTISAKADYSPSFNNQALTKTELSEQELAQRGINQIGDIGQQIANFHLTNQGAGSYGQQFNIRGLTNTPLFSEPAVVFYVDDAPYSSSMATMGGLFAIENIDIYRSSQPSRFGKNAYGGAVDIKTLQPVNQIKTGLAFGMTNFNQHSVTANSSGALIANKLYFSLNGQYQQRDGFLYNRYLNTHPDAQEFFSGRALLKWTPTKNWDIRFIAGQESFDYGSSRLVRLDSPDFFTINAADKEQLKQQADNQTLRIAYNNDDYELLAISSRRFWQMQPRIVDLDLLPLPFSRNQNTNEETWSEELRLRSKYNSDWQWQAGLFYSTANKSGVTTTRAPASSISVDIKSRSVVNYAAFFKLAYQGFHAFKPYLDVRVDYVDSVIDANTQLSNYLPLSTISNAMQQSTNTFFVSPKFGFDYTLSDNVLMYSATGLSFKPAGFAVPSLIDRSLSHYNKETLWHNELGIKTHWLENRFKLNLAGFYYQIDDYQVERFFTQLDYSMTNAKKAHSYGFEIESQTQLINNVWLETATGYTRTVFDNYHDPYTKENYAGKTAPFVPDFTNMLALQYKNALGYFARAEWLWTGQTYFDEHNSDIMQQNGYSIANLRLGYEQKKYSIYLFADNLTDVSYYTFKVSSLTGDRGAPGNPRIIGGKLSVNF